MKNIVLFVVLAVLTVTALVAWNVVGKSTSKTAQGSVIPTPTLQAGIVPSPTPESGSALRQFINTAGGLLGGKVSVSTTPSPSPLVTPGFGTVLYPTVTLGPTPIGGYTKGGIPVNTPTPIVFYTPTPTIKPTTTQTPTPTPVPGTSTRGVVTLTDSGFSPKSITIKREGSVVFINNASTTMWVTSNSNQLPGFDTGSYIGKGGSYEYRFSNSGTFEYHNNNNSSQTGTVVVTN